MAAGRTIAVLGGTGDQGYGLALRWAKAGERVIIGSRVAERAEDAARKIREELGGQGEVEGRENPAAVAGADIVVVSVPFSAQATTLKTCKDSFREGQILCDLTVALASNIGGPATRMIVPPHGSAAEQAADLAPKGVKVVSAFQNVSAEALSSLDEEIDCDVIVCGTNDAKPVIRELIAHLPGARYVDGGPLYNSRIVESITALLIGFNIRYKGIHSGIRISGIPAN
ncbi:MAG: NADPH-dependent F420 reductase [Dehalococcoidia bacterium]